MSKVVHMNWPTRIDLPVERVIERAGEADLESVIVIGHCRDGSEYFASSLADGGDVVWLLERMKLALLRIGDQETPR
jgi:hypothetical protein